MPAAGDGLELASAPPLAIGRRRRRAAARTAAPSPARARSRGAAARSPALRRARTARAAPADARDRPRGSARRDPRAARARAGAAPCSLNAAGSRPTSGRAIDRRRSRPARHATGGGCDRASTSIVRLDRPASIAILEIGARRRHRDRRRSSVDDREAPRRLVATGSDHARACSTSVGAITRTHREQLVRRSTGIEPSRQRAEPARRQPRREHLLDLLAERCGRARRTSPACRRGRARAAAPRRLRASASSSHTTSSRRVGRVERIASACAPRPRVLRREVAVLREQRRRLGVEHGEPRMALARPRCTRPTAAAAASRSYARVGALDRQLGQRGTRRDAASAAPASRRPPARRAAAAARPGARAARSSARGTSRRGRSSRCRGTAR